MGGTTDARVQSCLDRHYLRRIPWQLRTYTDPPRRWNLWLLPTRNVRALRCELAHHCQEHAALTAQKSRGLGWLSWPWHLVSLAHGPASTGAAANGIWTGLAFFRLFEPMESLKRVWEVSVKKAMSPQLNSRQQWREGRGLEATVPPTLQHIMTQKEGKIKRTAHPLPCVLRATVTTICCCYL